MSATSSFDAASLAELRRLRRELTMAEASRERVRAALRCAGDLSGPEKQMRIELLLSREREKSAAVEGILSRYAGLAGALERRLLPLGRAQARLLELRYIEALGWGEIAEALGYSQSHCFRLHKQALQEL